MRGQRVVVVGSFVVDVVMRVARRPQLGETVRADDCAVHLGGKGFNQAVAAARCGASVAMIGAVGPDPFGAMFLDALDRHGIDRSNVRVVEDATGMATPLLDPSGQNTIVVALGANGLLGAADIERAAETVRRASAVLLQCETSDDANRAAATIASRADVSVILNPAPAGPLPEDVLRHVAVLTPNESEAAFLTGCDTSTDEGASSAALALATRGPSAVLVTLGARGAMLARRGVVSRVPAYPVQSVDATGAGDAFVGALTARLVAGDDIERAARFASAAGALAVTVVGAEPSMPRLADVQALMDRHAPRR